MSVRIKMWVLITNAYPAFLRKVYKMDLGAGVRIAHKAHLDKSVNPQGVHIGDRTWVLNGAFSWRMTIVAVCEWIRISVKIASLELMPLLCQE